jgi:hypothetical protein
LHADLVAGQRQRQRQIDRDGGFADAALAAGHRDDVLDAGNAGDQVLAAAALAGGLAAGVAGMAALHLFGLGGLLARGLGGQHHADRQYAVHRVDGFFRRLAHGFQIRAALGVYFQRESDVAVLDHQTGNHALGDDVIARVRVDHRLQRVENLLFGHLRHAKNSFEYPEK